ncbi:transcobalamin-2 [Hyperolius riggenbachi]|uniref:transcobalamin-2 n=1 Tax=Hyperolius riggenbachi TaxID=752182 RepID=UPI0035A369B7
MALSWPTLVILVQVFIVQVQLYEIPEGHNHFIKSLNRKLLRKTLDVTQDANPSVYIGLRLSEDHNLEKEKEYHQRLKPFTLALSSSNLNVDSDDELKTGLVALHLMAQRASCEKTDALMQSKLIARLKNHLLKEKESIVLNGGPLTSYYQYSLGILALCVNDKFIDRHFINKLIVAEERDQFVLGGSISIDTEAMAGLALLCSKNSNNYPRYEVVHIKKAIRNIKEKILASQKADGQFGNIYSTPLAVQFFLALGGHSGKEASPKAMAALLEAMKLGKFSNPMMMSQLLPILHQKTYLDVAKMKCEEMTDSPQLVLSSIHTHDEAVEDGMIKVRLVVSGYHFNKVVEVPSHSSLLDVLETAQRQNSYFSYETKDSLHGPFLTTVNNVEGQWFLYKDKNVPLLEGVADYKPEDGEKIILSLSSFGSN